MPAWPPREGSPAPSRGARLRHPRRAVVNALGRPLTGYTKPRSDSTMRIPAVGRPGPNCGLVSGDTSTRSRTSARRARLHGRRRNGANASSERDKCAYISVHSCIRNGHYLNSDTGASVSIRRPPSPLRRFRRRSSASRAATESSGPKRTRRLARHRSRGRVGRKRVAPDGYRDDTRWRPCPERGHPSTVRIATAAPSSVDGSAAKVDVPMEAGYQEVIVTSRSGCERGTSIVPFAW